jgi:hypothetical protein
MWSINLKIAVGWSKIYIKSKITNINTIIIEVPTSRHKFLCESGGMDPLFLTLL